MSGDKKQRLRSLQTEIKRELEGRDPWFFPTQWGVDGYVGAGPVMFVAQRPSMGGGPRGGNSLSARAFRSFYESLKRRGYANAHITDLVKERKTVGKLSKEELDRNWPFLKQEISIVQPVVIVALGQDVLEPLVQRMDSLIPFWRVTHYSYRYGRGEKLGERFDQDVQRLKQVLVASSLPNIGRSSK